MRVLEIKDGAVYAEVPPNIVCVVRRQADGRWIDPDGNEYDLNELSW